MLLKFTLNKNIIICSYIENIAHTPYVEIDIYSTYLAAQKINRTIQITIMIIRTVPFGGKRTF